MRFRPTLARHRRSSKRRAGRTAARGTADRSPRPRHDCAIRPLSPGTSLGIMDPAKGTVTIEKLAANAVMAGCRPEYFPVAIAGVRAVLEPELHVGSTAVTTGGAAPVLIVSGPLARTLTLTPARPASGAIRGPMPHRSRIAACDAQSRRLKTRGMEKSTHAWPGKISMCFAENEARSPWAPLRTEFGFGRDETTVTAVAAAASTPSPRACSRRATAFSKPSPGSMRMIGCAITISTGFRSSYACPLSTAATWRARVTPRDVRERLFALCRLPVKVLRDRGD